MNANEPRIVELELRYMNLENDFRALSEVVAEQQRVLEALSHELRSLTGRVVAASEPRPGLDEERPPHY